MTGPTSGVGTDTLPEHQSALPICSGICAAQSLVLCVVIFYFAIFYVFTYDYGRRFDCHK